MILYRFLVINIYKDIFCFYHQQYFNNLKKAIVKKLKGAHHEEKSIDCFLSVDLF